MPMQLNHVADAAESTFTLPIKRRLPARDSIQERFEAFHEAHPEIYSLLVYLSRDVAKRGYSRYSMKAVFERARWHQIIEKGNREFTLNNDFTATYARLIMSQEPDLEGFFETRERVNQCR